MGSQGLAGVEGKPGGRKELSKKSGSNTTWDKEGAGAMRAVGGGGAGSQAGRRSQKI